MELRAGRRLDRYTLVAPLGAGGQATVWKAIDPLDGGAVCALKIFHMDSASTEKAERARREAKAAAAARHPGIVRCRSYVEDPASDFVILVFDWVRGRSLVDALADGRMTFEHRWQAVRQLADTLAYVHDHGIIHRDIKPDNVLVTDDFWQSPAHAGTLKLVDFGIAAPAGNPKPLTREGGVVGTTPYLPPELVDDGGLFDAGGDYQRDVFAFGVLAWEVLIGGHPTGLALTASRDAFAGVYLGARAGKRVWPPEAPASAELPVVRACLALAAADRPVSCIAVAEAFRAGSPGVARARTSDSTPEPSAPRSSLTEVHVPPRTAVPDDGISSRRSAPPVRSSRPGEVRSSHPPSGAGHSRQSSAGAAYQPVGIRISGQKPKTERRSVALVVVATMVGILVLAAGTYFVANALTSAMSQSTSVLTTTETPPPNLSPRIETPPPSNPRVVCCPSGSSTCWSGRPCQPAPCDPTTVGEGPWRLRLGGGLLQNGSTRANIQETWRTSQICVKNTRTGEEQCASSRTIYTKGSDARYRVLATTSDLVNGNFVVRVIDGITTLSHERAFGSPDGYKPSALCSSVKLHLRQFDPDVGYLSIYLDDP